MTGGASVAVVTGASAGIGLEIALGLARLGWALVLVSRDPGRAGAAREAALEAGAPEVESELVDLSNLEAVRSLGARLASRRPRLQLLVNNAGGWNQFRELTPEGHERTWASNQLGPFLLTELLLPALGAAQAARVVIVASESAGGLDLGDLDFTRRRYDGRAAYAQSKQANRMWAWDLARRLEGQEVTVNAYHPGLCATRIVARGSGLLGILARARYRWKGRPAAEGAETGLWLATDPSLAGVTGRWYVDREERPRRFDDAGECLELADLCRRLTGAGAPPGADSR